MTRCDVDADAAFGYLRRIYQSENKKLYEVAVGIVESRQLPMTMLTRVEAARCESSMAAGVEEGPKAAGEDAVA